MTYRNVRSLYKLADMEEDLSITLEPMGKMKHMRGHFGIVFHALSNGEVTVQISWHGRRPFHNFGTTGQIVAYEGSFWGSWWGLCTIRSTMLERKFLSLSLSLSCLRDLELDPEALRLVITFDRDPQQTSGLIIHILDSLFAYLNPLVCSHIH